MRMVKNFEVGLFNILAGAANASGGTRIHTHVVRTTNRSTIDKLVAALRRSQDRADALEAENVDLRARLAAANRATLAALKSAGL